MSKEQFIGAVAEMGQGALMPVNGMYYQGDSHVVFSDEIADVLIRVAGHSEGDMSDHEFHTIMDVLNAWILRKEALAEARSAL